MGGVPGRITPTSAFVDDQDKALRFCTDILGLLTEEDVPVGEHRWLTVVSPGEPDDRHPGRHMRQPDPDRAARGILG